MQVYQATARAAALAAAAAPLTAKFSESEALAVTFRAKAQAVIPIVNFLGLLDTVPGPDPAGDAALETVITRLTSNVAVAVHGVALDETRSIFQPLMLTPDEDAVWDPPLGELASLRFVEQTFFPGSHSDIGGGWPGKGSVIRVTAPIPGDIRHAEHGPGVDSEHALSEVVLQWLISTATQHKCGAFFRHDSLRPPEDISALLNATLPPFHPKSTHDAGKDPLYRILPGNMHSSRETVAGLAKLHGSVETLMTRPPSATSGYVYSPANHPKRTLPATAAVAPDHRSGPTTPRPHMPLLRLWRRAGSGELSRPILRESPSSRRIIRESLRRTISTESQSPSRRRVRFFGTSVEAAGAGSESVISSTPRSKPVSTKS